MSPVRCDAVAKEVIEVVRMTKGNRVQLKVKLMIQEDRVGLWGKVRKHVA